MSVTRSAGRRTLRTVETLSASFRSRREDDERRPHGAHVVVRVDETLQIVPVLSGTAILPQDDDGKLVSAQAELEIAAGWRPFPGEPAQIERIEDHRTLI